jgi:Zn-dependent protease
MGSAPKEYFLTSFTTIVSTIATWLVPLAIAIIFHEIAHGYVARLFGDTTAQQAGRLSLNPLRHIDPVGTVVLPMALALTGAPIFGWARPVPVDERRLRNPRWHMVLVALAGPVSNIILAILTAVIVGLILVQYPESEPGPAMGFIVANLENFLAINVFLAVFNMLPLPPFDGSKVLAGLLPPALGDKFRAMDRYGFLLVFTLLVIVPTIAPQANLVGRIVVPPVVWVFNSIGAITTAIAG